MRFTYLAAFLLLLSGFALADSFTDKVSSYGQQFEAGEINYLQFSVLLNNEREKLFDELNDDSAFREDSDNGDDREEEHEFRGWSQDKMRSMFGEPTSTEEWAWSPISRQSVRLSSPAPVWRKTLYDGRALAISLESWPQVIQSTDGQTTLFYHFDLRPVYKSDETFNTAQLVNEFKELAQTAGRDNEKIKQAAFKAVQIEHMLGDYLREKGHQCREILAGWFGYQGGQANKLKWKATVHEGERVTVQLNADESIGEWHMVNAWAEVQHREQMPQVQMQNVQVSPYMFETGKEYMQKLRDIINELKRTAVNFDLDPSRDNFAHLQQVSQQYSQLISEFNNRVGRQELSLSNDEAVSEIELVLREQGDFTKENVDQIEFKQSLFNTTREAVSSYCTSSETSCGETQTCSNAACVESTCNVQCSECQYADRTTCACVQVRECVPQQQQPDQPLDGSQNGSTPIIPANNSVGPVNSQNGSTSTIQTNGSSGSVNSQNNSTTTTPASAPRDPRDDGSCDCPPNPAPTCQPGYSAVSSEYQYNSPTCSSYTLTCWRTTCQPDSNSNASVKAAKVSGLFSLPYSAACPEQCSANQYCAPEKGWCECQQGYSDCDGDWLNGCESTKQCKECKSDSDCAPQRCSEDHGRIVAFQCKQGEAFIEQTGGAEFGGNCEQRNSGETSAGVWLSAWGDDFQTFDQFKQEAWSTGDASRCAEELEQTKQKRLELQSSLDDEFFNWFFENFVLTNPNDFENQGKAIRGIYEAFQHNSDDTARALRCLGRSDWPSEYREINAEIATDFGKVRIWEEKKRTSFWQVEQEIFSPYMKMWVFPPKEVFKRFFVEKIKEEGPKGPPPEDLAQMRNSPEAMAKIRTIANAFGGDARIIIQAVDEGEPLVKFVFIVNERDLIKIEAADDYQGSVSATVSVGLDFLYDVVSSVEKESNGERIEYPYWEEHREPKRIIDEAVVAVKVFTRIFTGIAGGEIKIEPVSALPKIVFILQEMMQMIMTQA